MKKTIFILISIIILMPFRMVYANSLNDSFIAIKPDKESCPDSQGHFLPLPDMDSAEASLKFLNFAIDKRYGKKCKLNGLLINGEISKKTFSQLKLGLQLLKVRRNDKRSTGANTLWLNSPGGLISEALKIGDLIGEEGMESIVTMHGHCYSSCVLIYAAAKIRSGIGNVGIHRPFAKEISVDSLSYSEYLKKYELLTPILKGYFSKYGVSPSIVDAMNIIPSDEIRVLSLKELRSYGLGYNNVAATEYEKAKTIQVCGKKFYDLNIRFDALVKSCKTQLGIHYYDKKMSQCWDLAHKAFPDYSNKLDACKIKKANKSN